VIKIKVAEKVQHTYHCRFSLWQQFTFT